MGLALRSFLQRSLAELLMSDHLSPAKLMLAFLTSSMLSDTLKGGHPLRRTYKMTPMLRVKKGSH